jgi:hypothetical protein
VPSAPSTSALGSLKSIASYEVAPSEARPIVQTPAALNDSSARAMFTTSAIRTCETAPADAFAAAPSSRAAWRA